MNANEVKTEGNLLTLEETAAFLRVSKSTIYRHRKDGAIRSLRTGRKILFRRSDIETYLMRETNPKEVVNG